MSAGSPGASWTTWASQIFSYIVFGGMSVQVILAQSNGSLFWAHPFRAPCRPDSMIYQRHRTDFGQLIFWTVKEATIMSRYLRVPKRKAGFERARNAPQADSSGKYCLKINLDQRPGIPISDKRLPELLYRSRVTRNIEKARVVSTA